MENKKISNQIKKKPDNNRQLKLANFIVSKFILIAWPNIYPGLLFSIIRRTDLIDSFSLEKGELREINRNGIKYTVRILVIGTLQQCLEGFSLFGNNSKNSQVAPKGLVHYG